MSDIIPTEEHAGEQIITSEQMAVETGVSHKAHIQLTKKHLAKIESRHGPVAFKMRVGKRGGSPVKIYLYTEAQSIAVAMLAKNSDQAVDIKLRISHTFDQFKTAITSLDNLDPTTALLVQQVIQQGLLKAEQERQATRLETIEATLDSRTGYQTISAWGKMNGRPLSLSMATRLGRKASVLCKQRGIPRGDVPDERFGEVKSYPIEIIDDAADALFREG